MVLCAFGARRAEMGWLRGCGSSFAHDGGTPSPLGGMSIGVLSLGCGRADDLAGRHGRGPWLWGLDDPTTWSIGRQSPLRSGSVARNRKTTAAQPPNSSPIANPLAKTLLATLRAVLQRFLNSRRLRRDHVSMRAGEPERSGDSQPQAARRASVARQPTLLACHGDAP